MKEKFNLADYIPAEQRSNLNRPDIRMIPFDDISPNADNFYHVDETEDELADSIALCGLLTPLGITWDDDAGWGLISGHRRLRAIFTLRQRSHEDYERWKLVPCIIYKNAEDADAEMLRLIAANAQRVKSGPELAREAREMTQILTRMQQRGEKLPGRLRDRAAEALQVSSARLARLDAIDHNLTEPGWRKRWENEEINESTAYRLSQMDKKEQRRAWEALEGSSEVTAKAVEKAAEAKTEKGGDGGTPRAASPTNRKKDDAQPEVRHGNHILPEWQKGEPLSNGPYWCKVKCGKDVRLCVLRRIDENWYFQTVNQTVNSPVLGWWPLPGD